MSKETSNRPPAINLAASQLLVHCWQDWQDAACDQMQRLMPAVPASMHTDYTDWLLHRA